ncbi:hypothetical protein [Reyranella sp.]|uniref:hypothetical protein n=1 Tax=Reyranella sp. TaxID=1929291 RepID=UPI003C7C6228
MAKADGQRALQRIGGEKGGRRREALGQQQDVEPAVERRVVAPGDDGTAVLARPGHDLLVGAADLERRGDIVEPLDLQDRLGGLAPRARDAAHQNDAQSVMSDDLGGSPVGEHGVSSCGDLCVHAMRLPASISTARHRNSHLADFVVSPSLSDLTGRSASGRLRIA